MRENPRLFKQKRINHLFHYTHKFENLQKIIENGFSPSYCNEIIDESDYYIPMVSFCNIPLTDVGLYMRYGDFGIGLELEWAISKSISPVVYVHHKTPFKGLHGEINEVLLLKGVNDILKKKIDETLDDVRGVNGFEEHEFVNMLKTMNDITVPALQFFKNWKTRHGDTEILTYQEREWRYIPKLEGNKRLIASMDNEYSQLKENNFRPKPHFPKYSLKLESIENLKYLVVKTNDERTKILETLKLKFGSEKVIDAIVSGGLLIVTSDTLHNDF